VPYAGSPLVPDPPELAKAKKDGASRDELKKIANKYPKAAWRPGVHDKGLKASDALPEIAKRASGYIADYKEDKPFFLYVPFTAPHTPVVPTEAFRGKSQAGTYGDFVQEVDWAVGEVVKALKASGKYENTLLIFATDNGYSIKAFPDAAKKKYGHNPSYIYNGRKGRLTEGGHRVPFLVTWPGVVKAGTQSDVMVCLTDFFATCAEITGAEIADNTAEDSVSFLPVLKGSSEPIRDTLVSRDFSGYLAIRKGDWKLCFSKNPNAYKLYNLGNDIGEQQNLLKSNPEMIQTLEATLTQIVDDGRSTPGAKQQNDGAKRWKQLCWLKDSGSKK
jgi:arylsulfatase A-like enzyme